MTNKVRSPPLYRAISNIRPFVDYCTLLLACLICVSPAWPAYQELDGIVAVVEDDVVLASELMLRLETVRKQIDAVGSAMPPEEILVSQVLERLVQENIQYQEARKRGIDIDEDTLTRAVTQFALSNNLTLEQFQQALLQEGTNFRAFREEIRREMIINALQRNLIARRVVISEQEIDGMLNSPFYKELFSDEYRVGHIMLSVDEQAGKSALEELTAQASVIIENLNQGAVFSEIAMAKSSSSSALEGGDMGWRKAAALPSLFSQIVLEMTIGQVSEPIVRPGAVHIIKLLDKRGVSLETVNQTNVRHILIMPSEIRTPKEAEILIKEIKNQLMDGRSFEELAREQSDDPASALNGGSLGWSQPNAFVDAFSDVMRKTDVGAQSEPFLSQFGWHILEVLGRREQDVGEDARKAKAVELIHRRRFEEEKEKWLKEIRDESFVEIRL